jgi:DNA invertase Pin-like site-specific DNA recombinase
MTSPQKLRAQKRQNRETVIEGILLARVSDPRQEDKFSLSSQDREGTSYAEQKNIKIVAKFIFQETASKAQQRKKFDDLVRFICSRPSTKRLALIVEKHDRLLRNDKSKADVRLLVESGRIEVHFFKLGKVLDRTSDPSEFLLDDVMASVNQYQARRTGTEAVKGMVEKARQGWPPFRPPLGYVSIQRSVIGKHWGRDTWEKIVTPDPDKAVRRWLVRMFELRASDVSFRHANSVISSTSYYRTRSSTVEPCATT